MSDSEAVARRLGTAPTGASPAFPAEFRTPRAAGVAGIIFALTLTVVVALWRAAIPGGDGDSARWINESSRRHALSVALQLVPYAGIAFLWFIGVVRNRAVYRCASTAQ